MFSVKQTEELNTDESQDLSSPTAATSDGGDGTARTMIRPLLDKYSDLIEELRVKCDTELRSDPDPETVAYYRDDLFLLRFLMSAKYNLETAAANLRHTMAWRMRHRDTICEIREGRPIPGYAKAMRYQPSDLHGTQHNGGPVVILRTGISDVDNFMKRVDRDSMYNYAIFPKEVALMECDKLTKKLGYIVKMVVLIDLAHLSMSAATDRRWVSFAGECGKETEVCYPQLLGANVFLNAPAWIRVPARLASLVLPASTVEKFVFCSHGVPTHKAKERKVDLKAKPYAWAKFCPPESIPTFLGGTCECTGGSVFHCSPATRSPAEPGTKGRCICGISNDRTNVISAKPHDEGWFHLE